MAGIVLFLNSSLLAIEPVCSLLMPTTLRNEQKSILFRVSS